jgi:hypothetical protein
LGTVRAQADASSGDQSLSLIAGASGAVSDVIMITREDGTPVIQGTLEVQANASGHVSDGNAAANAGASWTFELGEFGDDFHSKAFEQSGPANDVATLVAGVPGAEGVPFFLEARANAHNDGFFASSAGASLTATISNVMYYTPAGVVDPTVIIIIGNDEDGLPGDYNDDGVVNAADYVRWRNTNGQNVTLPNDVTSGSVTQADYDVWVDNFGAAAGSAENQRLVPETSSMALVALTLLTAIAAGRRRMGAADRRLCQFPRLLLNYSCPAA